MTNIFGGKLTVSCLLAIIFCALLLAVFPGPSVSVMFTLLLFYAVRKNTDPAHMKTVLAVVTVTFLLRIVVFLAVQYICIYKGRLDIFGDGQDNIIQGMVISDYFKGKFNMQGLIDPNRYNTHAMSFFNGFFFTIFGADAISLKYLNVVFFTLAGWLVYDFTKRIYSGKAGMIAMTAVLLWPPFYLWSATDLKESHLVLALVGSFWLLHKALKADSVLKRFLYLLLTAVPAYYMVSLKPKMMAPISVLCVFSSAVFYLFVWVRNENRKMAFRLVFFLLLASAVLFIVKFKPIVGAAKGYYGILLNYNAGFLNSGGWNYDLLGGNGVNRYSILFIMEYLAKGGFHFLTEPLPNHMYSLPLLAVFPFLVVWYVVLFFWFIGAVKVIRIGMMGEFFPILAFCLFYIAIVGMAIPNIGTVLRFRDTIVPFAFILAACAVVPRESHG